MNTTSLTADRCSFGCVLCTADCSKCSKCFEKSVLSGDRCEPLPGFGLSAQGSEFVVCASAGCVDCGALFSACLRCGESAELQGSVCRPKPGHGLDVFAGALDECVSADCRDCAQDRRVCAECGPLSELTAAKSCTPRPGFGLRLADRSVESCRVAGCADCSDDSSRCARCSTGGSLETDACLPVSGFGFDETRSSFEVCRSAGCSECAESSRLCTACDASRGFFLRTGNCLKAAGELALLSARFSFETQTATFAFSDSVSAPLFDATQFSYVLVDKLDNSRHPLSLSDIRVALNLSQLSVEFSKEQAIAEADLSVEPLPAGTICSERVYCFEDYPLVAERVRPRSSAQKFASGVTTGVSSVSSASMIALMSSNPPVALILSRFAADLFLLSLLNSPSLVYPNYILDQAKNFRLIPFDIRNPFQTLADQDDCEVFELWQNRDLDCSIFANYGQDLLILCATLVLNLLFIAAFNWLKRCQKKLPKAVQPRQLSAAKPPLKGPSINVAFTIDTLEGCKVELLCVIMIHLTHMKMNFSMIIGSLICGFVLVCYAAVEYCRLKWVWGVWRLLESAQPLRLEDRSLGLKGLPGVAGLGYASVTGAFEDFAVPERREQLLLPVFQSARSLLLALAVVGLARLGPLQLSLALLVESGHFCLLVAHPAKLRPLENRLAAAVSLLNVFYLLLVLAAAGLTGRVWLQQAVLGLAAACVLLLVALLNTLFVLASLLLLVLKLFRTSPSPDNNNNNKTKVAAQDDSKLELTK